MALCRLIPGCQRQVEHATFLLPCQPQSATNTDMETQARTVRLSDAELDALARAADADARTQAGLLRKIVADWLRANGWLKLAKKERS